MCGRYYVDDDTAREIEMLVGEAERKQQTQKNGDIRPSEQALVVNGKKDHLSSELMCWGFPGYQGKGLLINARSESILEKELFGKVCCIEGVLFLHVDSMSGIARKKSISLSDRIHRYFIWQAVLISLAIETVLW